MSSSTKDAKVVADESLGLLPSEWPGTTVMGAEERAAVAAVLDAKSPFRYYGPDPQGFVRRFEEASRTRLGRAHAVAVNSGTGALAMAMSVLGIGPGDEVLLPGYLWPSCISAVVRAGAVPRLVEIDGTFTMDPDDLERQIGPHTRAVLVVHMNGAAGHLDRVLEIAARHDLWVVEDVAQANGGSFHGRPLGAFGHIATFSFQINKTITAGEGGLVVTDDALTHKRLVAAHDLGFPRDAHGRLVMDDPDVRLWGHGGRMSELAGAMLFAQEAKVPSIVAAMRAASGALYEGLATIPSLELRERPDPAGDNGSFVLLRWPDQAYARAVVERTRARGVRSAHGGLNNLSMLDWGLHLYSNNVNLVERTGSNGLGYPWRDPANAFARDAAYGLGTLPATDALFARSTLLAVSPALQAGVVDRIVDAFRAAAAEIG